MSNEKSRPGWYMANCSTHGKYGGFIRMVQACDIVKLLKGEANKHFDYITHEGYKEYLVTGVYPNKSDCYDVRRLREALKKTVEEYCITCRAGICSECIVGTDDFYKRFPLIILRKLMKLCWVRFRKH